MDTHFAAAWIVLAHTFAAEGEHDQAISAYSMVARLFRGSHLQQIFLGMQHHAMNNMTAAEECLKTAYGMCKNDPLLLNEMGVVYYHEGRLWDAITMFRQARETEAEAWLGPRINLGHAYHAVVFGAKGLIYLQLGQPGDAVEVLHDALAIEPQDPIGRELLNMALESVASFAPGLDDDAEHYAAQPLPYQSRWKHT
ncbi:hypothetical protein NKR23_g10927 [Pleurostoma richardsiae]|uniref:Tetratricopeptide repeat protein n=1 Tax=Pleurostoma richardsiae TaxID=41990 RepID=A0AA38VDV8_9PEZI|nr:hypothetical protein NKR23_g10927 [Pleurostoma richardsiae]